MGMARYRTIRRLTAGHAAYIAGLVDGEGTLAPHLRSYKSARATLVLKDYVRLTQRNGKYKASAQAERERVTRHSPTHLAIRKTAVINAYDAVTL